MKLSVSSAWRAPLEAPLRLLVACAILFAPLAGTLAGWLCLVASASLLQPTPAILAGVALSSVGVVLWPLLLLLGYYLRTVREAAEGSTTLPAWNHWFSLTVDGLAMVVTIFLISMWPVVPFVVGGGLMGGFAAIPGMADPRNSLAATFLSLFGSVLGICCLIGFFLIFVALIVMGPMAILRLARTNSVFSAANPFALLVDIFAGGLDYLVFLSLVVVTYVVLFMALSLLTLLSMGILTPVAIMLAPITQVYVKLFSAQLLGQYGRAHLRRTA
ncbi:DUF4013 domain-containing protein [bacterium]|nr:DUF4013 domain-containing protein [bacterium]